MRRELTGILNGNLMRSTDTQTRVEWACGPQKRVGWACGPRGFYLTSAANVIPAPAKGRGCSGHCHPPCAPPSKRHARAGFTFTEVIMASSLLILAMVPILRALTQAHLGSVVIERRSRCLTLAQTKLDDIKARSIYTWTDRTEVNTSLDGAYLCTVLDVAQSDDLKKITVKVGYDLNGNSLLDTDEVEITLVTLVARRW